MSYILGMDTGGTYTDGVIVGAKDRKIRCKAKALTTKEDLTVGLKNCLDNLKFDEMQEIKMVSLSTTLATNAIVEGRGATVGLIYMGREEIEEIPAEVVAHIKGRFDIMGRLEERLDKEEIIEVLNNMKGKVEALAISGYASVRNPDHELEVKRLAKEILDVPVVCAHQLTSALGFQHRTVTATLNGRLIPIIDTLLKSTKEVLAGYGVDAPIMIVKGDGTLMTEKMAKDRPIETILSGPAASVIGGLAMTGHQDGIVLDMGGTTTDIAEVVKGAVKIRKEGAKVGGWFTRVQAVEISTFGLGGDSRICLDRRGEVAIGPEKVWPLCVVGEEYPQLVHELKSFKRMGDLKSYSSQEADCYMYMGGELFEDATDLEKKIFEKAKGKPHSLSYLARAVGEDPETIDMTKFVESGILARISVTPTDILHFKGKYNVWNSEISRAGIEILARRKEMPVTKFVDMVERAINTKMAMTCVQSAADFEGETFDFESNPEAMYLIERAFGNKKSDVVKPVINLQKPMVAIGAPARAWVTEAGKLLNAEVNVPEDADVANAYGAAVGMITHNVEILISLTDEGYQLNGLGGRDIYGSKEEAVFYAIHEGRKQIEHTLMDSGCTRWVIEEEQEDIMIEIRENEGKQYMGTKIFITGTGNSLNKIESKVKEVQKEGRFLR